MTARAAAAAARLRGLFWPVAIGVLVYLAWSTPFVYPLKIFVVFLHELSHGIAAIATGGAIVSIELSPDEGGLCTTRGGWPFVVTSAGYLGSLSLGALLLIVGGRARPSTQRFVLGATGAVVALATLAWVRSLFGFLWGLGAGAVLCAAAAWLPAAGSVFLLRLLGVTSCLYALWDIASDLIFRSDPRSDAAALARATGIPAIAWGVLWGGVALFVTWRALLVATGRDGVRTSR